MTGHDRPQDAVAPPAAPPAAPLVVRNRHAAKLIELFDATGQELRFAESTQGTRVHVVAPAETQPPPATKIDAIVDFGVGACTMVCGVRLTLHKGGLEKGGYLVGYFADERLCVSCHRAFGDRAEIIFENNLPPGDQACDDQPSDQPAVTVRIIDRPDTRHADTRHGGKTMTTTDTGAGGTEAGTAHPLYRVHFERLGRVRDVTFDLGAGSTGELAELIKTSAAPYLGSRHIEINLDEAGGHGRVFADATLGGRFTIATTRSTATGPDTAAGAGQP